MADTSKSKVKPLGQALEQAQEAVRSLKGDLQTSERESVSSRKRVEVEKFKSRLKEDELEVHKATQLYTERLNDVVKNIRAQA